MKRLLVLFTKYKILLLAVLKPLGYWGVGAIALLDSSTIPVPMDPIVALYVWNDKRHFILYCLLAAVGSAIGGLLPFLLGRAGGEIFLLKRIDRERYERMRDRFERQEFFAVLIPSMLPPPTPWKLFVFGAGVFEMKVLNFMLAVFLGRLLRFMALSLLTIRYGPRVVPMIAEVTKAHTVALLAGLAAVLGLLVLMALRKSFKKRQAVTHDVRPGEG